MYMEWTAKNILAVYGQFYSAISFLALNHQMEHQKRIGNVLVCAALERGTLFLGYQWGEITHSLKLNIDGPFKNIFLHKYNVEGATRYKVPVFQEL